RRQLGRGRDRQVGWPGTRAGHLDPAARKHLHTKPGAAHSFTAKRDGRRLDVAATGVYVRCVAEAELDVDGCAHTDQLTDLVQPDVTAEVVGCLDVDVHRNGDDLSDGGDLGQGQIRREIDGVGSELLDETGGRGIAHRQHHRDLRLHVGWDVTFLPHQ